MLAFPTHPTAISDALIHLCVIPGLWLTEVEKHCKRQSGTIDKFEQGVLFREIKVQTLACKAATPYPAILFNFILLNSP